MKFHRSYAVTLIAAALVACGGGGGGSTPPPPTTVTQSVTCPDGTSKTGTGTTTTLALDSATAQCLAPTLVSITPTNNAVGISPDSIAVNGIVIATSSTLATPAISDITLKAGTTSLPVTVTMTAGSKGFKFIPTTALLYAQAYTYVIGLTDTLGKKLSVVGGFTTASVSCTAPLVPDSVGTTCVPPVCPIGTAWNGSACVTTVLRYTDKVYAIWTYAYPYAVTKTGVTKVVNKTSYPLLTGNVFSLYNCWLPKSGALADGKVLVSCQEAVSLGRHYFYIDPTKDEMYDYAGSVPTNLQCTENTNKTWTCPLNTDWVDVQNSAPVGAPTNDGTATQVSDGWYFTFGGTRSSLKFKATTTGVESVVKAGDWSVDGSISVLLTFSN